jgi:hypothetical protein
MAHCAIHNQSYDENFGGYCIYCGPPQPKTFTSGGANTNICPECGHSDNGLGYNKHFDGCSRKTTAG